MTIEELRNKDQVTRQDITDLLTSIGKPGDKLLEKRAAVIELNKENFQGINLLEDVETYEAF